MGLETGQINPSSLGKYEDWESGDGDVCVYVVGHYSVLGGRRIASLAD
jgi:hypothetical protein